MVCSFDVPPEATKMRHDEDTFSTNDTKETKADEVLEILMDVPSSTNFVDIASNILSQLGIKDNSEAAQTGELNLYMDVKHLNSSIIRLILVMKFNLK